MKKLDKSKKKVYNRSDYFLLGLFVLLLIVFIGVFIYYLQVKHDYNDRPNISVPVMKDNLTSTVNINVSNKKKDDVIEYSFIVRNYNNSKINKDSIKYLLFIDSYVKADFDIKSNGKEIKLKDNKSEYMKLEKNKKKEIRYDLTIKLNEKTGNDYYINLNVEGVKDANS